MKQRVKLIVMVVLLAVSSAALAMSLGLFKAEAAQAATCNVPSGFYPTIQSAVNDISCDTVNLTDAVYVENINIDRSVTILGQGADTTTVDGNASGSVFEIHPGLAVTITDIMITNGRKRSGGGINNIGSVVVLDAIKLTGNASSGDAFYLDGGGGIYNNNGVLRISNSTLSNNSAHWRGGGIYNTGILTVTNSQFNGNLAIYAGGGIESRYNASLAVTNSSFIGNSGATGAGISSIDDGILIVSNCTFSGNIAGSYSGGGWGGGISSTNNLTVTNSTFSDNYAGFGGGGLSVSGIGIATLANNIFNENYVNKSVKGNCDGSITSQGYNISSDDTCFSFTANGDLTATNPLLGPLQDNGGDSFTHALLLGSPAIDAGNPAVPGSGGGSCTATDQRGVARPQGVACDIGSFEATLIIGKSGPTAAATASTITYTLEVVNNTSVNLSNVVITDSIPVGAIYLGGGTQAGNIVSWIVPDLAPGVSVTRSFAVVATSTITNSRSYFL